VSVPLRGGPETRHYLAALDDEHPWVERENMSLRCNTQLALRPQLEPRFGIVLQSPQEVRPTVPRMYLTCQLHRKLGQRITWMAWCFGCDVV
jgi:hypothetical protein